MIADSRNYGLGWNDLEPFFKHDARWVNEHPWIHKVPIHFLRLRPGMGITVPSKTYHNVMALDGNRILMNMFFVPKYKAVENAAAAKHSWFEPGAQADTYRAMWHLKA